MKRYLSITLTLVLLGVCGCKKHHTLPKVPPPDWTFDQDGKYPASMTVVVQLPDHIRAYMQETDQIAAFIGDECRGTGTLVSTGNVSVFFILIHGTASEQSKLSFKYYSSLKMHLYSTPAFLDFIADGSYGSADNPRILELDPVR